MFERPEIKRIKEDEKKQEPKSMENEEGHQHVKPTP